METKSRKINHAPEPESVHTLSRNGSPPLDSAKGLLFLLIFCTTYNVYPVYSSQVIENKEVKNRIEEDSSSYVKTGLASWYSTEACKFNPQKSCPTASGKSLYTLEKDNVQFAASYDFALGRRVKVTNLRNGKSTTVEILDRGPNKRLNRTIDLGKASFAKIADTRDGIIPVEIEVLS